MDPLERTRRFALLIYDGDSEKMERFFEQPHVLLENLRPKDVAINDPGADKVIALLGRAAYGGCA